MWFVSGERLVRNFEMWEGDVSLLCRWEKKVEGIFSIVLGGQAITLAAKALPALHPRWALLCR